MLKVDGFTASPQQRRLWGLGAQSGPLRARVMLKWEGPLQVEVLKRCLCDLTTRHESLRTRFAVPHGLNAPVQIIDELRDFHWREQDFPLVMTETDGDRDTSGDYHESLNATLFREGKNRYFLLLDLPSICVDSESLNVLARDLAQSYAVRCGLQGESLDEEPVQYAQYAEWLLNLEAEDEGGKSFWNDRWAEVPRAQIIETGTGPASEACHEISLGKGIPRQIETASRRLGMAAEVFWWTCWAVLIARQEGTDRTALATHFSGRSFEELDSAVGPFARFLPLSAGTHPRRGFADVVREVASLMEEAETWQHFHDPDRNPANATLAYAIEWEEALPGYQAGPVSVELCRRFRREEPFLVKLCVSPAERRLLFHYDAKRISGHTIRQWARRLRVLLGEAARAFDRPLGSFNLLAAAERHAVLFEFNDTAAPRPETTFPAMFECIAGEHPDRIAIIHEDCHASYGWLEARSNQVAEWIRSKIPTTGAPVALCFFPHVDLFASMLGVMKAGAVYLPLDPHQPHDRLRLMLAQSGARLLLAQEAAHPPSSEIPSLLLHEGKSLPQSDTHHLPRPTPDQGAYLIFTSGSTGMPKGVLVTQRNLVNYLLGAKRRLGLENQASYALVSTTAADLGNTVIFSAWAGAGVLHALSREKITHGRAFADYMEQRRVDALKLTPSHLTALMDQERARAVLPRHVLILGGEKPAVELLQRIQSLKPGLRVFNHYGPTETTIGVLARPLLPGKLTTDPVLGRPLANNQAYLLNAEFRPAIPGTAGELFIGGLNVTTGYLDHPASTARAFLPNPYSQRPGARLYRSGDLFRLLSGNRLGFLGRTDHQIKIRGYRVELGEIEAALRTHDDVCEAVVQAWENQPLAAYLVSGTRRPKPTELSSFLRRVLPDYMVPGHFTLLERFPLNANGKIDRGALPQPGVGKARAYVPPRHGQEAEMAAIWEKVLGVVPVGAKDHFFEMGGHSLLMVKLISAIERRFCKRLPIAAVYRHPTVETLTAHLQTDSMRPETPLVPLRNANEGIPWILFHPIGGQVHWYYDLARYLSHGGPVSGVQSPRMDAPGSSLESAVTQYIQAILEAYPVGPYYLAGWSAGGSFAFEAARQLSLRGDAVAGLVLIDAIPFHLLPRAGEDPVSTLLTFAADLGGSTDLPVENWRDALSALNPEERMGYLRRRMVEAALLPTDFPTEDLGFLVEIYRANRQALSRYQPETYRGNVTLIRAGQTVRRMEEGYGAAFDPSFGWRNHCPELTIRDLDGDHYSILSTKRAKALATLLRSAVTKTPTVVPTVMTSAPD